MICKIYAFETATLTELIEDESISFGGSNQPVYSSNVDYALVTGSLSDDIAAQAVQCFTDTDSLNEWKMVVGFNNTKETQ